MTRWLRFVLGTPTWQIPPAHPTVPIRSPRHGSGPRKRLLPRIVVRAGVGR